MDIWLKNSATGEKERFEPLDPGNVRMYVCGPTVYDRAHLGNARPVVVFDVLFRLLRHVYGEGAVSYVRNFTDIDDKIIARADETGRPISEITEETTRWYLDDMAALGALEPTHMPRATGYIGEMVAMIETLIAKGFAYTVREPSNNPPEEYVLADRQAMLSETALFEVRKFEGYGALSGRSVDDMIAGARVEVAPWKRDPMDFVLWKPSTPDQPGWDSPWGRGRPGWHIECSAMAKALLGDTFDIHGGGGDLLFPHHENERAQSCCANGTERMASVWLHNEMLQVEGKKMSKSLGNFFTVREILEGNGPRWGGRFTGPEVRMAFLMSHYRDVVDFGLQRREEARTITAEFAQVLGSRGSDALANLEAGEPLDEVVHALRNDLDTVAAIGALRRRRLHECYSASERISLLPRIFASQLLLGFDLRDNVAAIDSARNSDEILGSVHKAAESVGLIEELRGRMIAAREAGNYAESDEIRNALVEAGAEVSISKDGIRVTRLPNFDPTKLEALK